MNKSLAEVEREAIVKALKDNVGSPMVEVAFFLGIARSTLYRKIEEYKIKESEWLKR